MRTEMNTRISVKSDSAEFSAGSFNIVPTKSMRRSQVFFLLLWIWFFLSIFKSKTLIRHHESSILKEKLRRIQNSKSIFPNLWQNLRNPEENIIKYDPDSAKSILYSAKVYGMDHWGIGFGSYPFEIQGCRVQNCILTNDTKYLGEDNVDLFDAVLLPIIRLTNNDNVNKFLPVKRSPRQRYIAMFEDSPRVERLIHPKISDNFVNWTMTYRQDSDVPHPYGVLVDRSKSSWNMLQLFQLFGFNIDEMNDLDHEVGLPGPDPKTKLVAWVVSNCANTTSQRMEYAKELGKYIDIDIFGRCGNKNCSNPLGIFPCDDSLKTDYKFYLAFENSICTDYVTEKLFNMFLLPMVPVVLGGAEYSHYAPPNSYIDVTDFESPKAVADYLIHLDRNQYEYNKYFEWKRTHAVIRRFPICALCEMLHSDLPEKSYPDLHHWWYGTSTNSYCISKLFSRTLGLT